MWRLVRIAWRKTEAEAEVEAEAAKLAATGVSVCVGVCDTNTLPKSTHHAAQNKKSSRQSVRAPRGGSSDPNTTGGYAAAALASRRRGARNTRHAYAHWRCSAGASGSSSVLLCCSRQSLRGGSRPTPSVLRVSRSSILICHLLSNHYQPAARASCVSCVPAASARQLLSCCLSVPPS